MHGRGETCKDTGARGCARVRARGCAVLRAAELDFLLVFSAFPRCFTRVAFAGVLCAAARPRVFYLAALRIHRRGMLRKVVA